MDKEGDAVIKIAVISDIHFGVLARSNEFIVPGEIAQDNTEGAASLSEGFIRYLKEQSVQYLFIPGDLTSKGKPQEFHYCAKKIIETAQKAHIQPENIIWGTGNHDLDWGITKLVDDYKDAPDEVREIINDKYRLIAANAASINMGLLPQNIKHAGIAPISGVVERDDFIVFILNSSLYCSHDQKISHGKLDAEQLDWFKKTAGPYKDDPRWKIILMHHHPYNYAYPVPSFDVSGLEEGSELQSIAGEAGIHLVIHGHRHHPRAESVCKSGWKSPITFVCAGSFSVNSNHRSGGEIPNTFHIIELSDTPGILKLKNFEYSLAEGWVPFHSNRPTTPLDAEMFFGKIIQEEELNKAVLDLIQTDEDTYQIRWQDVPDELKYSSLDKVNTTINQLLSAKYCVYDKFPNDICLLKRKEDYT